jgi:hypothetical protein
MYFFWPDVPNRLTLFVAEHHVEYDLLHVRANGRSRSLIGGAGLGLALGRQSEYQEQESRERSEQTIHGSASLTVGAEEIEIKYENQAESSTTRNIFFRDFTVYTRSAELKFTAGSRYGRYLIWNIS